MNWETLPPNNQKEHLLLQMLFLSIQILCLFDDSFLTVDDIDTLEAAEL